MTDLVHLEGPIGGSSGAFGGSHWRVPWVGPMGGGPMGGGPMGGGPMGGGPMGGGSEVVPWVVVLRWSMGGGSEVVPLVGGPISGWSH